MDGTFQSGDKLPPERQLTEQLGVSRSSLREALKALEVLGLVESRQGEGSFIINNIEAAILKSMSIAFKLNDGKAKDILELRYCLEVEAAKVAILRSSDEQIQELEDIVNRMLTTEDESEKEDLDLLFHDKLIKNTGNILFQIIADSISNLMKPFIKSIREIYKENDEEIKEYYFVDQHLYIVNAIKERNIEKAVNAIEKHIKLTDEDLERLNNCIK